MREFLKFGFKSREGLISYLAMFGVSLCGLFMVHMVLLGVLKYDGGGSETVHILIYEMLSPLFAAAALSITAGRMMRTATNGGTSRRSFLLGMGLLCPVFAVISTAMTVIAYLITYAIFSANGMRLSNIGFEYIGISSKLLLDPRVMIFNMTIIFSLMLLMYTLSLIYMGVKSRFGGKAGFAAAGLLGLSYFFSLEDYDIGIFRNLLWYLEESSDDMYLLFEYDPYYPLDVPAHTFPGYLMIFIVTGAAFFLAAYLIYFLLARRAPVRGKV